MIGRIIAIVLSVALLTMIGVAMIGRLWRFVLVQPPGPHGESLLRRIVVLRPDPQDYARQRSWVAALDLPCAAFFLLGSCYLLATGGIGGAWLLTFAFWCVAAVVRWLTRSQRIVPIRCGIVLILILDAVLSLLIRGGGALPQALAYLAVALVGTLVLYQTSELPLPFAPQGPYTSFRRGAPVAPPPAAPAPDFGMHFDTMPSAAQRRPMAQVTPISYARRNPLRVREDEGAIVSPPYYASSR